MRGKPPVSSIQYANEQTYRARDRCFSVSRAKTTVSSRHVDMQPQRECSRTNARIPSRARFSFSATYRIRLRALLLLRVPLSSSLSLLLSLDLSQSLSFSPSAYFTLRKTRRFFGKRSSPGARRFVLHVHERAPLLFSAQLGENRGRVSA